MRGPWNTIEETTQRPTGSGREESSMRTATGPFKSLSQHRTADTRVECSHEVLGTDLVQGFRPVDPEPRCTTAYHYVPDKNGSSGTSSNRAMTGSSRI